MNQRFYSMCGMLAPVWFVLMTIFGGAIRPGYSHVSDTVSELFSPGSPNKMLLGTWLDQAKIFLGFRIDSFISIGVVVLTAVVFAASCGGPYMGLAERIAALVGFQWTFVLAWKLYKRMERAGE